MKKIIIGIILFVFPLTIYASEKIEVSIDKCVDGDTAWFVLNNEKIKTRFLAIDTPESTNEIEEYGKEASTFTCNLLEKAVKIEIEYDNNSDKFDKYQRHLVWIFVDNNLLQKLIIEEGLAEIKYIYGDYKYLNILNSSLEIAKKNELNLWSKKYLFILFGYKISEDIFLISISLILLLVTYIFNIKNKTYKIFIKYIKKMLYK